ncbi:hypothetical protein RI88_00005, partial [Listeria monocytogenes]|nr:hypothetical protein [Listeria monocytogenes]
DFPFKIKICSDVIKFLKEEYRMSKHFEIGGILLGKINQNRNIITIEKLYVIKSKKKFRLKYIRNDTLAQKKINKVWTESNGIINYIGEWHTHSEMSPFPSITDNKTIIEQTIEKKSRYFPYTLLLIIGKNDNITLTISDTRRIIECILIQ